MRLALLGHSGTIVGKDYRGEMVLAAYNPVKIFNLGIVAKIDIAEIQAPFIRSGLIAVGITLFVALLTIISVFDSSKPILQKIKDSEQRFHQLFRKNGSIALLIDPSNYQIIDANDAALFYYGYTLKEIKQLPISSINIHAVDIIKNKANEVENHKLPYILSQHKLKNGEIRDVQVFCSTVSSASESVIYTIINDVTEQNRMQEHIQRTQKMEALGNLTGGIAHDFNNLLGVVNGYAELLEDMLSEQPKLAKYAIEISHAGERGARLTRKLLAFSRKIESRADKINLNRLLLKQKNMLEKTLTVRIKLVFNLVEDLWPVWLDANELEDAILNVSINAMHAIEGNGQLTFKTRNVSLTAEDAKNIELIAGDYVVFSVIDTGCGMDKITQEKIFEPFFSTKGEKGTGLGLSQVYGFVKNSKGSIRVYSEFQHGTQLLLYFPRYQKGLLQEDKNDQIKNDLTGNESIVVVDDEPALLDISKEILIQNGYQVFSAECAEQALVILANESIDLLISDVIMPDMDGYQLASIVNKNYPAIKIQLISGFTDDRHLNMIDEELHHNLLYKPLKSNVLLKRIRDLLDEK